MNLFADENVDRQIVEQLRFDGHEVLYVAELEPSIPDNIVFDRANERSALLLTEDKDFCEIVFRDGRLSSGGVVLLRLAGLSVERKTRIVSDAFRENHLRFLDHFTVISPGKIRMRPKIRSVK